MLVILVGVVSPLWFTSTQIIQYIDCTSRLQNEVVSNSRMNQSEIWTQFSWSYLDLKRASKFVHFLTKNLYFLLPMVFNWVPKVSRIFCMFFFFSQGIYEAFLNTNKSQSVGHLVSKKCPGTFFITFSYNEKLCKLVKGKGGWIPTPHPPFLIELINQSKPDMNVRSSTSLLMLSAHISSSPV